MKKILHPSLFLIFLLTCISVHAQEGVRIKDVANISGMEDVQLFGYGLVMGLDNTGDENQTVFTQQTVINMLKNVGVTIPNQTLYMRNVAAVMVIGTLAPYKRKGTKFDVIVSSMGDATSLDGGALILTPLQGPDGAIYASAQGPLSLDGNNIRETRQFRTGNRHSLTGRIPDGAIVQREYAFNLLNGNDLSLSLCNPDFSSAVSMAKSINKAFPPLVAGATPIAQALDAATVSINYPAIAQSPALAGAGMVGFIARVENLTFEVSSQAKVVVNERTGTIVAGGAVRISQVAVSHGGIKVEITSAPQEVEPHPFVMGEQKQTGTPDMVTEKKAPEMLVLGATTTVSDLAQALNSLGVAPQDVIAILQAIKEAGALQAQLVIL